MIIYIPIPIGKKIADEVLSSIAMQSVSCTVIPVPTEPDPSNRRIGEFRGRDEIIRRSGEITDEFTGMQDSDAVLTWPDAIAQAMALFADPTIGYVSLRRSGLGLTDPCKTLACAIFRRSVLAGIKTPIPVIGTRCCCKYFEHEVDRQKFRAVYSGVSKLVRQLKCMLPK